MALVQAEPDLGDKRANLGRMKEVVEGTEADLRPSGAVVRNYVFLQANIVPNYQSAQIIVRESFR